MNNSNFDNQSYINEFDYYYHSSLFNQLPNEYWNLNNCNIDNNNTIDNKNNNSFKNNVEIKTQANTKDEKTFQNKKVEDINQLININKNNNTFKEINTSKTEESKNKNKSKQKKCGRKRMRTDNSKEEHNKYTDDNIRRKCKHLVLKNFFEFINIKISKIYNGDIGNGVYKKELQTINQSQISDATINFNKNFVNKKLGDIFSADISGRFTNIPSEFNKILINKLMNEEDINKKIYFNKVFNITFIECMKHFIGQSLIKELEGMKCFNEIKDNLLEKYIDDGNEYISSLEYYLNNYEEIINNKKSRKPRKQK